MPHFCCVVNCASRSNRDNVQFYRIPSILHFKHKVKLNELSALRRQKWINAIRRKDFSEEMVKNARLCSKHFISRKLASSRHKIHTRSGRSFILRECLT
ncbi:unnamed protein product [Tenebrio molitor]|nr:unnamed protein product [Tenebrio molitor]